MCDLVVVKSCEEMLTLPGASARLLKVDAKNRAKMPPRPRHGLAFVNAAAVQSAGSCYSPGL